MLGSGRLQSTVLFVANGMAIVGRARAEMAGMTNEEEAPEEPILDSGISLIPDDASAGFLLPAHSLFKASSYGAEQPRGAKKT
ncbi:hypothetical protein NMY22_g17915 [Coprinellus aureogranulatus]|nr:hypothetical protein NMY22_g17915 [Coprinellus aureogranulatus]